MNKDMFLVVFRRYLSTLALIIITITGCISSRDHEETDPQLNFILIYTDELQFSDLGCYAGQFPTPHIDRLAREGMMFSRAYTTASMCTPSRYSVLTGQYPGRCTAATFLTENPIAEPYNIAWNTWITEDKMTLAKVLSEHGYVTGMAGKWHVGWIPTGTELPEITRDESPGDALTNQKLKDAPFFLYFATTAVHGPNHVADLDKDVTLTPKEKILLCCNTK
jgi:hypothetical protein